MRMRFLGMKPQVVTFNDTSRGSRRGDRPGALAVSLAGRTSARDAADRHWPGHALVSSGYGTGSELVGLSFNGQRWRATNVWKTIRLKSKFANIIRHGGFLYGLDDGALVCVELATRTVALERRSLRSWPDDPGRRIDPTHRGKR